MADWNDMAERPKVRPANDAEVEIKRADGSVIKARYIKFYDCFVARELIEYNAVAWREI